MDDWRDNEISEKQKLKTFKQIGIIISALAIVGVSFIYYFFEYKNHRVAYLLYLGLLAGWVSLFLILGNRWIFADKISWKADKAGALKQGFTNIGFYFLLMAVMFFNG